MDPGQLKGKEKEGEGKKFTINFKVIAEPSKGKYNLKVVKPDLPQKAGSDLLKKAGTLKITYPTVYLKTGRSDNQHAFFIMHNLHHRNILSMKALAKNKTESDDPSSAAAAFVEPYSKSLEEAIRNLQNCADNIKHLPSSNFQTFIRDIIIGLDFLWKNDLYHGNLNWGSTLWHNDIVKLAGFEKKDMRTEDAQFEDLQSLIRMLEEVSNRAALANQGVAEKEKFFCGILDSLIDLLKTFHQASLPSLKEAVLEHPFFWNFAKRSNFFARTVSLKLIDDEFMTRVRDSNLCGKPWDKLQKGAFGFRNLVKKMNDYRKSQKGKHSGSQSGEEYDGGSIEDYVRFICGAYTHWRQLKEQVDSIIRTIHPMICIDMKRLIEAV